MNTHILGIRHHGPGCARHLREALETIRPDLILVEGPPEAEALLQWADDQMQPPVALLFHETETPRNSVFYPFAVFSPEWQAIQYAREHRIPLRFMDLPATHNLAWHTLKNTDEVPEETTETAIHADPTGYLAEAAGYADGEKWWEAMFEQRRDGMAMFEAIAEAMTTLRQTLALPETRYEQTREAWMRKTIRQAEREMYSEVAIICGAWHVPALATMPKQKDDNELLKGLPKVKTEGTWVPWTYERLSLGSGYGAGIVSPGWYHHLWQHPQDDGTIWQTSVATLFRQKDMDISTAHVIEAVRLGHTLAAIRALPFAGLDEMNEATTTVMCMGDSFPMQLIHNGLVVSNRMGVVPDGIPRPPLQADIEKQQKKLRLPVSVDYKDYQLDLRKENDLERSIFLNRLQLLHIHWGTKMTATGKGTFREEWRLQWNTSYLIDIIAMGTWGNTLPEAATAYVLHQLNTATLTDVTNLLQHSLLADLPEVTDALTNRLANVAASAGDVLQLMEVVPGLVQMARYGNVRQNDTEKLTQVAEGIITRICIALPPACCGVSDDAATDLLEQMSALNEAINTLQHADSSYLWEQALQAIASNQQSAPILNGYAVRFLYDRRMLEGDELNRYLSFALSVTNAPATAAGWLEGFLRGSGMILLLDDVLWHTIETWMASLPEDAFIAVLPLLRRTFAHFSHAERRKMGEKAKNNTAAQPTKTQVAEAGIDHQRALQALPIVHRLLGITSPANNTTA